MSNRSTKRGRRAMWKKLDKKEAAILDANHYWQKFHEQQLKKNIFKILLIVSLMFNFFLFVSGRV